MLNVSMDIREAEKMLSFTERDALPKATTRALNKTVKSVQSVAIKLIAKDIGIAQKDVRKSLYILKSKWTKPEASLIAGGQRIPIIGIKARQTKAGVTYRSKGGGRGAIPGAFIAKMESGHKSVFKRLTKKRFPLVQLYGPSIPKVFIDSALIRAMENHTSERFSKILAHELKYELSRRKTMPERWGSGSSIQTIERGPGGGKVFRSSWNPTP